MSILSNLLGSRRSPSPPSQKTEPPTYNGVSRKVLEQFLEQASAYQEKKREELPELFSTLAVCVKQGEPTELFQDMQPAGSKPWYFIGSSDQINLVEFILKVRAEHLGARLYIGRGEMRFSRRIGDAFTTCSLDEYVRSGIGSDNYRIETLPTVENHYSFPPLEDNILRAA